MKPLWQAARDEQLAKAREEAINNAIQVVIAAEAAKQAQAQAQAQAQHEDGERNVARVAVDIVFVVPPQKVALSVRRKVLELVCLR